MARTAIPYSPLAGGFLTGKYRRDAPIPGSDRAANVQKRYFNDRGWATLDALESVAGEHGAPPAQVALAWLRARPPVTAPIVGANTPDQLDASLGAAGMALSEEQVKRLEEATPPHLPFLRLYALRFTLCVSTPAAALARRTPAARRDPRSRASGP
jgi:aryl-alcohol dehydrogenase-like predicted oxidoreductase